MVPAVMPAVPSLLKGTVGPRIWSHFDLSCQLLLHRFLGGGGGELKSDGLVREQLEVSRDQPQPIHSSSSSADVPPTQTREARLGHEEAACLCGDTLFAVWNQPYDSQYTQKTNAEDRRLPEEARHRAYLRLNKERLEKEEQDRIQAELWEAAEQERLEKEGQEITELLGRERMLVDQGGCPSVPL